MQLDRRKIMGKLPHIWLKEHASDAKRLTDRHHTTGYFNGLISVVGLNNVLKFVDLDYLINEGVDVNMITKSSDMVEIISDAEYKEKFGDW